MSKTIYDFRDESGCDNNHKTNECDCSTDCECAADCRDCINEDGSQIPPTKSLVLYTDIATKFTKSQLVHINRQLEVDPNNVALLNLRIAILETQGQYASTLADYSLLLKLQDQHSAILLLKRAKAHDKLGDHEAALRDYDIILEHNSSNILALFGRSDLLFKLRQYNPALQDIEKILTLEGGLDYALEKRKKLLDAIVNKKEHCSVKSTI